MPNATLEFNLPDEEPEFHFALCGERFYVALCELDSWLRSKLKYGHEFKTADEALQEMRDELRDLVSDIPIRFDFV